MELSFCKALTFVQREECSYNIIQLQPQPQYPPLLLVCFLILPQYFTHTARLSNLYIDLFCSVVHIDCIEEMNVTSVTSPIGLWTAARKPIVLNLGSEKN